MDLKLSQPVKDLKGKILLDAGRDPTEWAKSAPLSGEYLKRKTKFKEAPQFLEDAELILQSAPYTTLLDGWAPQFKNWLGELWAPTVIFEELKLQRFQDPYGYRHVLTIAIVGARLLELWIKAAPTLKRAFLALLTHELGKTRMAANLISKGAELSELERRMVFEHPLWSFVLNAHYWGEVNHLSADVALHHHEDRIGAGYPRAIKTNSLILDILRLMDRFDALISDRPFRYQKFSVREALDILTKDAEEGRVEADVLKAVVALARKEKITSFKKVKLGTIGRPTDFVPSAKRSKKPPADPSAGG